MPTIYDLKPRFQNLLRPMVERLPSEGPAIVVANHNSHLDTMVLITLLPARLLRRIRPVAAADYFLASAGKAWFALNIVGILPIKRQRDRPDEDLLAPCYQALEDGKILIFFLDIFFFTAMPG